MIARIAALGKFGLLLAVSAGVVAHAQSPLLVSGYYGDHKLQLVVSPDGTFSGSFFDEVGAGRFSCGFLLHGEGDHTKHGVYKITTWWPTTQLDGGKDDEVISGTLRTSPKGLTLQLPKRVHDGCGVVDRQLDAGMPVELRRGEQQSLWRELRVLHARHASLRQLPEETAEASAEMEQGDVVAIVATRGTWQHVTFYSYTAGKTFSGWVQESDLLPFSVPKTS